VSTGPRECRVLQSRIINGHRYKVGELVTLCDPARSFLIEHGIVAPPARARPKEKGGDNGPAV